MKIPPRLVARDRPAAAAENHQNMKTDVQSEELNNLKILVACVFYHKIETHSSGCRAPSPHDHRKGHSLEYRQVVTACAELFFHEPAGKRLMRVSNILAIVLQRR